ncbi:MAG: glycosyltransferase [Desulfuromonadaceae bacterium]
MFTDPSKDLIVITTESKWDETPRMRHYIAHQLSRFFNVLFIEIYSKGVPRTTKVTDSLIVHRLGGYIRGVHRFRLTKYISDAMQACLVGAHIKKYKTTNVILLNFRFDFWQVYTLSIFKRKYFFLNDDFVNMLPGDTPAVRDRKQKRQDKVISLSDLVFVSSEPLGEDVAEYAKAVTVAYSGHDFTPIHNHNKKMNGKINVCFMGYVHANLKVDWIKKLAAEPNVSITFIGPIEHQQTFKLLSCYSNIEFLQPLRGIELQQHMSTFDIFIMPYSDDLVNSKATVPAKLFQYIACGRPIVSSLMPNLISLPERFVYQATTADEFVHLVLKASEEDSVDLYNQRIEYANGHSWNKRGEKIFEIIRQNLASAFSLQDSSSWKKKLPQP